jgi:hypothetical protein
VREPGVNSGFMIAHVTAAALASENKSLAHPASVDSLPTSANQEDHVSMATFAARRLDQMAHNTASSSASSCWRRRRASNSTVRWPVPSTWSTCTRSCAPRGGFRRRPLLRAGHRGGAPDGDGWRAVAACKELFAVAAPLTAPKFHSTGVAMDFRFKAGTLPLLVSMPHVGTDIPDDVARA